MVVPASNKFYLAVLEISDKAEKSLSGNEIIERIANQLSLSESDLREMVPSGLQTRVENRTTWAISKLKNAGLLEYPTRGQSQITRKGREFLANHRGEIQNTELNRMRVPPAEGHPTIEMVAEDADALTPDEQMARNHEQHEDMLSDEILDSIKSISPASFERIVVALLSRMGYGSGQAIGRSGDQGIDGILNQDTLGLEKVYIQAKRYAAAQVGEPEIRNFSGSLDPYGATKGVFITTSTFSQSARQTAQNISRSGKFIRLIDGQELAALMIRHGVGVVTEITYEVKKLDANYFAEV